MLSLAAAGVGVPGLYQGLVPGQGLSLSLSHSLSQLVKCFTMLLQTSTAQRFNWLVFWFIVASSGFGGRGVLPGVATGTGLSPKSSKI